VPDYMQQHLGKLVGMTIIGIAVSDDDGEEDDGFGDGKMYGLILQKRGSDKETVAWISRDEEGNGPGWLDLQKG